MDTEYLHQLSTEALQVDEFDGGEVTEQADQLQEALRLLDSYHDELIAIGGVSKVHAQALTEQCGVELPKHVRLDSFTTEPSRTNLTVTQEGIVAAAVRKVKELGKALIELIRRALRWIGEQLRKLMFWRKDQAKTVDNAVALKQATDKMEEVGVQSVEPPPSVKRKIDQLREVSASAAARYEESYNALFEDFLNGNKIAQRLRPLLLGLPAVLEIYEQRLEQYGEALTDTGTNESRAGLFASLAEPEVFPSLNQLAVMIAPDLGKLKSPPLSVVGPQVHDHLQELSRARPKGAVPPAAAVLDLLTLNKTSLGVSTFLNETVLLRANDRVNRSLEKVSRFFDRANRETDALISKAQFEALRTLQAEAIALNRLVNAGLLVDQNQDQLIRKVMACFAAEYRVLVELANVAHDEIKQRAHSIHQDLTKRTKR